MSTQSQGSKRIATSAALAVACVVCQVSPAMADHMASKPPASSPGSPPCELGVWRTDNKDLFLSYGAGMGTLIAMRTSADAALDWYDLNTDLVVPAANRNDPSDWTVTNVVETSVCGVNMLPLPGNIGPSGLVVCAATNSAGECGMHEVHFDAADTLLLDAAGRRSLACHEFGHGVGLGHRGGDTCMSEADGPGRSQIPNAHDKLVINAAY